MESLSSKELELSSQLATAGWDSIESKRKSRRYKIAFAVSALLFFASFLLLFVEEIRIQRLVFSLNNQRRFIEATYPVVEIIFLNNGIKECRRSGLSLARSLCDRNGRFYPLPRHFDSSGLGVDWKNDAAVYIEGIRSGRVGCYVDVQVLGARNSSCYGIWKEEIEG